MANSRRRGTAQIFFRSAELTDSLAARGDTPSQVAKRDLLRYYALLAREARAIHLTEKELQAIREITISTFWDKFSIPLLWVEVDDGLKDGAAAKWGIEDPAALLARLKKLTAGQTYALVDQLEIWWRGQTPDKEMKQP